jgi:hypothetical protein
MDLLKKHEIIEKVGFEPKTMGYARNPTFGQILRNNGLWGPKRALRSYFFRFFSVFLRKIREEKGVRFSLSDNHPPPLQGRPHPGAFGGGGVFNQPLIRYPFGSGFCQYIDIFHFFYGIDRIFTVRSDIYRVSNLPLVNIFCATTIYVNSIDAVSYSLN